MSEQPLVQATEEPLLSRPAATVSALRDAVTRLLPSRVPEFDRRLVEASTTAQTKQDLRPLRLFCRYWGQVIEIQRHPDVARRLDEMLAVVDQGQGDTRTAISEISAIMAWADAELDA